VSLTELMTEGRVNERRGLDTGEAADGRIEAPMDMVMLLAAVETSSAVGTAGEATLERMARNENGKRRRSEVPATTWALGDWRSRMECTAQQQACKLAQNYHKHGKHGRDAHCSAAGIVARDEIIDGRKREKAARVSPG
jgi:hypothetical protein